MTSDDEFYARRWASLEALDSTVDHWYWRPGWRVGRSFYTWHLTFAQDDPVRRLATFYQDRVREPFLDRVPLDGLHLTIQGIGFTDEVNQRDLDRIQQSAAARLAALPGFDLTVGPADADSQGVPLAIRPIEAMTRVRTELRAAIADVWGADRVPEAADGFHPHVTLFYCNQAASPSTLRATLGALRDTPPVTSPVREISLIRLNRDHKVYAWQTVATAPLA